MSGHGAKCGESDLFHEPERVESEKEQAGRRVSGEKKIKFFLQKHAPARSFYGSSLPPTPLDPDTWVHHEG